MQKYRRTMKRGNEFGEVFEDAEWQMGYEFVGKPDGDRIAEHSTDASSVVLRWHLASACELVDPPSQRGTINEIIFRTAKEWGWTTERLLQQLSDGGAGIDALSAGQCAGDIITKLMKMEEA